MIYDNRLASLVKTLRILLFLSVSIDDEGKSVAGENQCGKSIADAIIELQRFEAWCKNKHIHKHTHLKLTFEDHEPLGRFFRAEQSIPPGEELVEAPLDAVLSSWSAPASFLDAIGRRLPSDNRVRDMVALVASLLEEYAKADASSYAAYNVLLPSLGELRPAMTWSDDALQWLPPRTRLKAELARRSLKEVFETVVLPSAAETPIPGFPELFTWPRFLWAYGIVSSRSFNLSSFSGVSGRMGGLFLFPGGDLLNHHPNASVAYAFEENDRIVSIRTLAPVRRNEQVFNNYGAIATSEDSLLGWGFILGPHFGDIVSLPLPRPRFEDAQWRLEVLHKFGFAAIPPSPVIDDPQEVLGLFSLAVNAEGNAIKDLIFYWCVLLAAPRPLEAFMQAVRFSKVKSVQELFVEFGVGRSAQAGGECRRLQKGAQLRAKASAGVVHALSEAKQSLALDHKVGEPTSVEDKIRGGLADQLRNIQEGIFSSVLKHELLKLQSDR